MQSLHALGRVRMQKPSTRLASTSTADVGTTKRAPTSFHHGVCYVNYEVNTFALKFNTSGVRVLVDPWFVGNLTFADQDWLYTGKKRAVGHTIHVNMEQVASETDLLILTQALDDHTHMPTLRLFSKSVPVLASPAAAKKIAPLGFKNVTVIDHGQTLKLAGGRLQITATLGALVGPPWSKRQNGLVFRETPQSDSQSGTSVYYEPHCDFDATSVAQVGPVDVVISPIKTASLGLGSFTFPLTMGALNLQKLLKILKPKVLVPLLNSETDHEGPLSYFLSETGCDSLAPLKKELQAAGLGDIRVEWPSPPGESMAIAL